MKIIMVGIAIIACILMIVGAGCFSIVQFRHAKRNGGYYRSLIIKPTNADIKLMIIGAIWVCLGFFVLYVVKLLTGGTINLAE